jgi:DNA polymerase III gamma/tau subunit
MTFEAVRGQDRAVNALRRALASNRVAHAYIFTGPRGVGKMTAAVEFATAKDASFQPAPTSCARWRSAT